MQEYNTGAKRSERMPRFDLVTREFIRRVAERATGRLLPNGTPDGGALKYGEGNWEKGLPTSDVINHVMYHLTSASEVFRRRLCDVEIGRGDAGKMNIHMLPWPQRMEYVRQEFNNFLDLDDHLAGAAWGIMVLMEQQSTGFFHDPLYEKEENAK